MWVEHLSGSLDMMCQGNIFKGIWIYLWCRMVQIIRHRDHASDQKKKSGKDPILFAPTQQGSKFGYRAARGWEVVLCKHDHTPFFRMFTIPPRMRLVNFYPF